MKKPELSNAFQQSPELTNSFGIEEKNKLGERSQDNICISIKQIIGEIEYSTDQENKQIKIKQLGEIFQLITKENNAKILDDIGNSIKKLLKKTSRENIIETIQKIFDQDWKIEKEFEMNPFYTDGEDIKFHRAFGDGLMRTGIDDTVIENIGNNDQLEIYMNILFAQKKICSPIKSQITTQTTDVQELTQIEQEENQELWQLTDDDINHRIIAEYLWTQAQIKGKNNSKFNLNLNDINVGLTKILAESYKNDISSKLGKQALGRYRYYEVAWEGIFQKKGLPKGTSLLAYTESRVGGQKFSSAYAGGFFQFTEESGKRWGLTINQNTDERFDPIKSAEAAATYIKRLQDDWHNYLLFANHKEKIMEEKYYVVQDGDTATSIASKINISLKVLSEYNNIDLSMLKPGMKIRYPNGYGIDEKEKERLKDSAFYLALASYNGNIVNRIKGSSHDHVSSYEEYLQIISNLIHDIKKYSEELNYIAKTISEKTVGRHIERIILIYSHLNKYFLEKNGEGFFDERISQLKKLKASKTKDKIDVLNNLVLKNKNGKDHLKNWYNEIIVQNLFYPPNLFAIQTVYAEKRNDPSIIHASEEFKKNRPTFLAQMKPKYEKMIAEFKLIKQNGNKHEFAYTLTGKEKTLEKVITAFNKQMPKYKKISDKDIKKPKNGLKKGSNIILYASIK